MSRQKLSVRKAVGEAFGLGFRRPVSVMLWGLVSLLFSAAILALVCWMFSTTPGLNPFGGTGVGPDPEDIRAMLTHMVHVQGASALLNLLALLMTAVLVAAATRAVLKPRGGGLGYMRLGGDEFRVLVIQFAFGLGAYFLIMILALIGLGVGLAAWPLEPVARYAVIGATGVILLLLLIWVCLRASLITPMTVAIRQFAFIEGWRLSRGRVWRLLGIALLSGIVSCLVSLLILPILAGFAFGVGFTADMASAVAADPDSIESVLQGFAPDRTTLAIAAAVALLPLAWVSGMSVALAYGPWASACRQLMASDESGGGGDALVAAPAGHGAAEAAHAEPAHDAHGHEAAAHDAHSHDSHGHEAHGHADHDHGGGHHEAGHDAHGHADHGHADHGHGGAHGHDAHAHDAHAHDDHGHAADGHGHEAHAAADHGHEAHGHADHGHADHGHEAGHDDHHGHDSHAHADHGHADHGPEAQGQDDHGAGHGADHPESHAEGHPEKDGHH